MKHIILYVFLLIPASMLSQSVSEKADAYLVAAEKAGLFSGSVLIDEKDKVVLKKGYGYRDVDAHSFNDANTIYQVGSLTKQFTSTIILLLAEQGKLQLDDKLSKYFPDFVNADKITIEHLLTHTSGLPNFSRAAGVSTERRIMQENVSAFLKSKPVDYEAGTKYRYNNTAYVLLGYIIEKITATPYEQVVRENILSPLGMNNSGFDFKNLEHKNKAVGYNFIVDGKGFKMPITDSTVSFSAGAMYSTIDDLEKWNQAIQRKKILKESSLRNAFTPRLSNYGLGWKMDTLSGKATISHTGSISGFKSYNIFIPKDNIRLIILSNYASFNEARAAKDLISILNNKPVELPKAAIAIELDEQILKQYVGKYQLSPSSFFKIKLQSGQLQGQVNDQPELDFFARSEKDFFMRLADIQLEFIKNQNGEVENVIINQGGRPIKARKVE